MKQLLTLSLFIILSLPIFAQQKQLMEAPTVDKRVELLSIVFRLAGNGEYNATFFKQYTDNVANHFEPYKDHEIVQFARELHQKKGISYEAVMNIAIMLDKDLNPLTDFSITQPERWSTNDAIKFAKLLKAFYKDAKCEAFFNANDALFKDVETRFRTAYEKLDLNWFHTFYGVTDNENFNMRVSLGCGDQNYGTSYTLPNAKKEVIVIMGTWKMDESGMPVYDQNTYLPIMVHEFNHPFVNPLMAKHKELFEESGKEIYKAVEYEMSRKQAYNNWQIMLDEALVRAATIKYFIDHGANKVEIQMLLKTEEKLGFLWVNGLIAELMKYQNQRDIYPTLESYLPNLSNAYKPFAEKISQFDAQRAKVESITEFSNNDTNVDPHLKTFTINFDRPMSGKHFTMNPGSKGESALPKFESIKFINDNKSVVFGIQLMPNHEYQFILSGLEFKAFEVNFKTQ